MHNPGLDQPPNELSYPNWLALSPGERPASLYAANTNFDLLYNGASVVSLNLDLLETAMRTRGCYGVKEWVPPDGGPRVVADNTRYPAAMLDGGIPIDAGESDAGMSPDDGGVLPAPPADDAGLDAGTAADGSVIVLPAAFVPAELGTPVGTLCNTEDWDELTSAQKQERQQRNQLDCCFDTAGERADIVRSEFAIDSFAAGIGVSQNGERVYVPVASRNTLVYLDVEPDGKLTCGTETERCRRGPHIDGQDDDPNESFPGTLSSMAIGRLSEITPGVPELAENPTYVATTHDQGGFSLFIDRGVGAAFDRSIGPVLESVGRNLPLRPRALLPDPRLKVLYVASVGEATISRLGVRLNPQADRVGAQVREAGPREIIYQSTSLIASGVAQPEDVRDLALDPVDSSRLYGLVREFQASLAFLQIDPEAPIAGMRLIDAVRVGAGPSKVLYVTVGDRPYLLVSCYDAKAIYVIDPNSRELVSVIRSFSGPFEMAFDAGRQLLHVTDFRSSVLRVVDLSGLGDSTLPPPRIIATIGTPRFKGAI